MASDNTQNFPGAGKGVPQTEMEAAISNRPSGTKNYPKITCWDIEEVDPFLYGFLEESTYLDQGTRQGNAESSDESSSSAPHITKDDARKEQSFESMFNKGGLPKGSIASQMQVR